MKKLPSFKILRFLCVSLTLASACTWLQAEEPASKGRVLLDWSEQIAGEPAKQPTPEIYFAARHEAAPVIVDAQTRPPSPFPNEKALHLPLSENPDTTVAIFFNPFLYEAPPPKGWIEAEVMSQSGIISIGLGVDSTNMESVETMATGDDGKILCTVFMIAEGERPLIVTRPSEDGQDMDRIPLSSGITMGTPHVFRISWDWTSDQPGLEFQMDGEPLLINNTDKTLPVDIKNLSKGIDKLTIFLNQGGNFLGKVTASE